MNQIDPDEHHHILKHPTKNDSTKLFPFLVVNSRINSNQSHEISDLIKMDEILVLVRQYSQVDGDLDGGKLKSGINGPPDPGTDRSESVRNFQKFVGPGPVRSRVLQFFSVLVRPGPRF